MASMVERDYYEILCLPVGDPEMPEQTPMPPSWMDLRHPKKPLLLRRKISFHMQSSTELRAVCPPGKPYFPCNPSAQS